MKVLVIGSGGREDTLAWKLSQSTKVDEIFVAPGNAGTAEVAENVDISDTNLEELLQFAQKEGIDLTFVGPEAPLVAGIVDSFEEAGLKVFGPNQDAAQLEGSKVFSKNLMKKYDIPTAKYEVFTDEDEAITYVKEEGAPIVVKAEGLAAGKGVVVAETEEEAIEAIKTIMVNQKFGEAGERLVIEEYLTGEEATLLAFTDGETIIPMLPSQDHKQAYDNDKGPNTGGMGAYAPAPVATDEILHKAYEEILVPTIEALKEEGIKFKGILYSGLMIEDGEAKVLEYNVRFGDPEAQVVLPLLETDLVEIAEAIIEEELAEFNIEWSDKTAVCVVMASGGYPIDYETGKEIKGINEANDNKDTVVFQAGTEYKDNKLVTAGGRVLGVTALGKGYKDTIKRAYQAVEKIDFADVHYRSDIGDKALNYK
jgi:phosphoribosylamine--glycine ligase